MVHAMVIWYIYVLTYYTYIAMDIFLKDKDRDKKYENVSRKRSQNGESR